MSTWLRLLPMELDSIGEPDIIEPDFTMAKDERIIGTMSNTIQRLFTLGRLLEKDAKQYALDYQFCTDRTKKLELKAKAVEFQAKAQVVKQLMWIGLHDEMGLWDEAIGIRTGFKVVLTPPEDDNPESFFGRLFGGLL